MITHTGIKRSGFVVSLCLLGTSLVGCDTARTDESARSHARPVSYMTLEQTDPSRRSLVAGSVETWKKELVGFQVDGRVTFVNEPGGDARGRVVGEDGAMLETGTLLASVEDERYRLRVEEAQARVTGLEAEATAVRIDIEKTIPSERQEVRAEYDRAKADLVRQRRLKKSGAGAQRRVDEARAQFRAVEARLAQVDAKVEERKSRLAATEAQVAEAREVLRQAQIDAADTRLHAPFDGQISKVHVIPGGFVERGQPVVTLQMMDPMKVQVAVSSETDQDVNYNDLMKVYVDGVTEPLQGWVWNKDAVADAATRTFVVTLLVRNRQVEVGLPSSLEGKNFHRTPDLWSLESERGEGDAPFFTNSETLQQDDQGYFVWRVEGLTVADLGHDFDPVFRVRKIRVTPGERLLRYLQVFTYRELADLGDLNPRTDLLAGRLPAHVEDGDTVFLSRKRWLLRPGQLVNVDLQHGRLPAGFYVPAEAVTRDDEGHHVYLVGQQENGEQRATRVPVRVGASAGTLQAIEPAGSASLDKGMKLIVEGVHYLRDGDAINAFSETEQTL
ncbi:MAG: HlyD family efflux transporter periplasmic adaptor subunit [Gammaproteobacteria bacterium]|nr:HlyD family efflux transporter periplasmic adaptor subunit [Gammaproteobacteria bacterium]